MDATTKVVPMRAAADVEPMRAASHVNLGCGGRKLAGYLNVDRDPACGPDLRWDLERRPWPLVDGCASEVVLAHVLEYVGGDVETYFGVLREVHRICRPGARVLVIASHPRHDAFVGDPAALRGILPETFAALVGPGGAAGVAFAVEHVEHELDPVWARREREGAVGPEALAEAIRTYANVVRRTHMVLRALG